MHGLTWCYIEHHPLEPHTLCKRIYANMILTNAYLLRLANSPSMYKKLARKFQITRISQFVPRFKNERIRQGVIAKMPCWRISMWICWCIFTYLLIYVFNFARIILIRAIIQNQMRWMLWWTFCWPTARKMTHITLRPLTILCHSIPNSG